MTYSIIGILAVLIHCIINVDIFRKDRSTLPAERDYRLFLLSVIAYHITDALWGILHEHRFTALLYGDTVVYFVAMAISVVFWCMFVVQYLEGESRFEKSLIMTGRVLFFFQILTIVLNFFSPVLFFLDETGEYHAGLIRYVVLSAQIVMFLMSSVYTFSVSSRSEGSVRRRHMTIGVFGIAMMLAILAQIFYPLLPLYSIGYLLGGCVLHTFVVEDEKAEYLKALEESLGREAKQKQELGAARLMAYTDPMTGVKNKRAFEEAEEAMDARIAENQVEEFAVAVFDLNGLKDTNDTLGHKAGDLAIVIAGKLICDIFKHSPVYRIGGDEFAAILEREDYHNRNDLMADFDHKVDENLKAGQVAVAGGCAEYDPAQDENFSSVFQRADHKMYRRKNFFRDIGLPSR